MRLIIEETANDVAEWSAKYVMKKINTFNPGPSRFFVLGLPTGTIFTKWVDILLIDLFLGGTPLGMYKKLIDYHKQGKISFKYVKTFNMDEYVNLPRDHPQSYHYFMYNNFFRYIDIDPANVFILNGNAPDLQKECEEFEDNLRKAGGVDLFIGGKYVFRRLL